LYQNITQWALCEILLLVFAAEYLLKGIQQPKHAGWSPEGFFEST